MSAVCCWSLVRDQEVGGSNPRATTKLCFKINCLQGVFWALRTPKMHFALFVHRQWLPVCRAWPWHWGARKPVLARTPASLRMSCGLTRRRNAALPTRTWGDSLVLW